MRRLIRFTRHFRVQVAARVAALVGVALLFAFVLVAGHVAIAVVVGVPLIYLAFSLVHYVEATTRDVTRFLEGIRYEDFSQHFVRSGRGGVFRGLEEVLEGISAEFRRVRAEREEQVHYLQHVVDHVGVALVVLRADGSVERINAAARRLLDVGRVRTVEALGAFSPALVEAVRGLRAGGHTLVRVEREGRVYVFSINAAAFQLRGTAYTLVSLQDIGNVLEEKEMEAWQQLTRVLTHEIMNSVAPIASLAATANSLLARRTAAVPERAAGAEDDVREALQVIHRRSEALVSFVDAYRSFTRIPQPVLRMVPAVELFDRVRQLLQAQAQKQDARLEVHVDPPTLQVAADPDLLEQVLINLVVNALQAVSGRPGARVQLRGSVDRRGLPVLEVVDDGPGIPPEVQERIFVPFFTTREDGSGIGLSLSRQIMRLHAGTLTVRSEPGVETVFALRF